MHDGGQAGFYVGVCVGLSLYIDSCEDVEFYDGIYLGMCTKVFLYVYYYEDLEV